MVIAIGLAYRHRLLWMRDDGGGGATAEPAVDRDRHHLSVDRADPFCGLCSSMDHKRPRTRHSPPPGQAQPHALKPAHLTPSQQHSSSRTRAPARARSRDVSANFGEVWGSSRRAQRSAARSWRKPADLREASGLTSRIHSVTARPRGMKLPYAAAIPTPSPRFCPGAPGTGSAGSLPSLTTRLSPSTCTTRGFVARASASSITA